MKSPSLDKSLRSDVPSLWLRLRLCERPDNLYMMGARLNLGKNRWTADGLELFGSVVDGGFTPTWISACLEYGIGLATLGLFMVASIHTPRYVKAFHHFEG